jgi:hypothetical protein
MLELLKCVPFDAEEFEALVDLFDLRHVAGSPPPERKTKRRGGGAVEASGQSPLDKWQAAGAPTTPPGALERDLERKRLAEKRKAKMAFKSDGVVAAQKARLARAARKKVLEAAGVKPGGFGAFIFDEEGETPATAAVATW